MGIPITVLELADLLDGGALLATRLASESTAPYLQGSAPAARLDVRSSRDALRELIGLALTADAAEHAFRGFVGLARTHHWDVELGNAEADVRRREEDLQQAIEDDKAPVPSGSWLRSRPAPPEEAVSAEVTRAERALERAELRRDQANAGTAGLADVAGRKAAAQVFRVPDDDTVWDHGLSAFGGHVEMMLGEVRVAAVADDGCVTTAVGWLRATEEAPGAAVLSLQSPETVLAHAVVKLVHHHDTTELVLVDGGKVAGPATLDLALLRRS